VVYVYAVVDGDIVSGVPKRSQLFKHVRLQVTIDALGTGSIIIDPSFVEKWLRMQRRTSVSAHALGVYRRALLGVKSATEFMRSNQETQGGQNDSTDQFDENIYVAAQFKMAKKSAKAALKLFEETREDSVISPFDALAAAGPDVDATKHDDDANMPTRLAWTRDMSISDKLDLDTSELVSLVEASDEQEGDLYSRASLFVREISTRILGGEKEEGKGEGSSEQQEQEDEDEEVSPPWDVELSDRGTTRTDEDELASSDA
jgi:hypothetical protein